MQIIEVKNRKDKKKYIQFIYNLYKKDKEYSDLNIIFVKNFLYKKDTYSKRAIIKPIIIEDEGEIKLVSMFISTNDSSELKLSFLEFLPNSKKYLNAMIEYGKNLLGELNLEKIIVGINGQISYGLGILLPGYNSNFEFNSNYNPSYYTEELDTLFEINKNAISYLFETDYALSIINSKLVEKVCNNYEFRYLNKKKFKEEMILFGELCDKALCSTPYYSRKTPNEMYELMKQMKFLIKNEDIIFAMKDNKEVGFLFAHPDYCELFDKPKINYIKLFFKILFKKPKKIIYNVIGVLPEHQKSGLAPVLIYKSIMQRKNKYTENVSSFILEENVASNTLCKKLSVGINKKYRLYEMYKEKENV